MKINASVKKLSDTNLITDCDGRPTNFKKQHKDKKIKVTPKKVKKYILTCGYKNRGLGLAKKQSAPRNIK